MMAFVHLALVFVAVKGGYPDTQGNLLDVKQWITSAALILKT